MAFFSSETPTGTINGTNKTFTTANNINTIMTTTVDGSIYTGTVTYTAGTKIMVLADAPTVSITVSYFNSATGVSPDDGILVSTLKTAFGRRKQDITDVDDADFFQWCNNINEYLYNNIKGTVVNSFLSTGSYTVSAAPSSQALPSDFQDMVEDGTGVFTIDDEGDDTANFLTQTGFGRRDVGYYLDSTNIVFTGIEDGTSFEMRYLPTLNSIDATTDRLIVTARWQNYLINALDVCYSIWDEDPSAEFMADQRFIRSLEDILGNIAQVPQVYQMDDPMTNF